MAITTEQVKALRDETGVSVMQCKKALEEADGDKEKALVILRKQSAAAASKKADRELGAGRVSAYIHSNGSVGAMVVLSCETDFVANNEEFGQLAYNIAMQVAALNPQFLRSEDINEDAQKAAREVFEKEVADKPKDMQDKILQGKLDAYFKDKVLLNQTFFKDDSVTVGQLIESYIQKFGERIELTRFTRFSTR